MPPKGAFTNYVDMILNTIDHLPTPCWHLWRNSFSELRENLYKVDISSTTYLPTSSSQRSLWMTPNVTWLKLIFLKPLSNAHVSKQTELLLTLESLNSPTDYIHYLTIMFELLSCRSRPEMGWDLIPLGALNQKRSKTTQVNNLTVVELQRSYKDIQSYVLFLPSMLQCFN